MPSQGNKEDRVEALAVDEPNYEEKEKAKKGRTHFTAEYDIRLLQAVLEECPYEKTYGSIYPAWQKIAETLTEAGFDVDARRCRDRSKALLDAFNKDSLASQRQSGSTQEMMEKQRLLQQIVDRVDVSKHVEDSSGTDGGSVFGRLRNKRLLGRLSESSSSRNQREREAGSQGEEIDILRKKARIDEARWEQELKEREERWSFEKQEREQRLRLEEQKLKMEQEKFELDKAERERRLKLEEERLEVEREERLALIKLLLEKHGVTV